LPYDLPLSFVDGLYDGLLERAAETGVCIVGGNVTGIDGPVVIDLTLIGVGDNVVRRAGAVAGDLVVVTGGLGAAAEGFRLLDQGARITEDGDLLETGIWTESSADSVLHCLRAQLDPAPPLAFARMLSEHIDVVHAAMDMSDGMSSDIPALCRESGVLAMIETDKIPIDPHVRALERARGGDPLELALHGGEDYQMLMAVPPDKLDGVRDLAVVWDLPVTVIGEFVEGAPAVTLKKGDRLAALPQQGHDSFRLLEKKH
jgi:thiamine-monophosphate kinase